MIDAELGLYMGAGTCIEGKRFKKPQKKWNKKKERERERERERRERECKAKEFLSPYMYTCLLAMKLKNINENREKTQYILICFVKLNNRESTGCIYKIKKWWW